MIKSITLWREKVQWCFKETSSRNIYAENIKNKEIVNIVLEGFMGYLYIAHESLFFCEEKKGEM
jgi:hypothetical protein